MRNRCYQAFTLIELMIGLVIAAILRLVNAAAPRSFRLYKRPTTAPDSAGTHLLASGVGGARYSLRLLTQLIGKATDILDAGANAAT